MELHANWVCVGEGKLGGLLQLPALCTVNKARAGIWSQVHLLQGLPLTSLKGKRKPGLCPIGSYHLAAGTGKNMTQLSNSMRQYMLNVPIRMLGHWSLRVQKRRLPEGLNVWGSDTRHMEASRTRPSVVAIWRADVFMGAGGHSLGKFSFQHDVTFILTPVICKETGFVARRPWDESVTDEVWSCEGDFFPHGKKELHLTILYAIGQLPERSVIVIRGETHFPCPVTLRKGEVWLNWMVLLELC